MAGEDKQQSTGFIGARMQTMRRNASRAPVLGAVAEESVKAAARSFDRQSLRSAGTDCIVSSRS